MEIDGAVYGVPAYCNAGNGLYYVFNQAYLDKYHIDVSQVTPQLDSIAPLLRKVAEKEQVNVDFIPLLPYEYMIYAPEYSELLDMIQVNEKDGTLVAQNILENEEIRNNVRMLNTFRKIAGFQFDGSAYKKEIDGISEVFYQYSNLFRGFSEDVDGDYENLLNALREKGVNDVLAGVNRQLEEWNAIKK